MISEREKVSSLKCKVSAVWVIVCQNLIFISHTFSEIINSGFIFGPRNELQQKIIHPWISYTRKYIFVILEESGKVKCVTLPIKQAVSS